MIKEHGNMVSSSGLTGTAVERAVLSTALPEEPLIKIRTGREGSRPDFKDLWAHRELLYFLIWRDLKVRYKQTVLGAAWVVLQPLLTTIVFTVFMSRLARVPSDGVPYPLFSYSGLLPWLLFSNAVQISSQSLIVNSYIITKVYFPRLIIPAAVVAVRLVDFLVSALLLFMLMLYYGVHMGQHLLLFPLLVVQVVLLTLGMGLWTSVMTAKYRDLGSLLTILLQLWMFASPVIYPSRLVPERWRLLYSCNPMAGLVEGMRSSLFGLEFNWTSIVISAVITLALLAYSVRAFSRMEAKVIDIL